jgi:hypothetical protein
VRQQAGSSSEVIVRDMMDARILARAEKFGIRSVPAVVIDGKLASCCTGRGVDIQVLKDELGKTAQGGGAWHPTSAARLLFPLQAAS